MMGSLLLLGNKVNSSPYIIASAEDYYSPAVLIYDLRFTVHVLDLEKKITRENKKEYDTTRFGSAMRWNNINKMKLESIRKGIRKNSI